MRTYLHVGLATVIVLILAIFCSRAHAQAISLPEGFEWTVVNDQLASDALGFAALPDGRILVISKGGSIDLIVNGTKSGSPVMTLTGLDTGGEKGLLGIAVDPDFPLNPFVYLFYSTTSNNHVSRYTVSGDILDPNSLDLTISPLLKLTLIADLPGGNDNHNGGTLRFGADKTLYISIGDDVDNDKVQNLSTLNGKILRINRDGTIPTDNPVFPDAPANARDEVFAFGMRNPFRFSIDTLTDELFVADVGQSSFEELDLISGGENLGWPRYEGNSTYSGSKQLINPAPVFPFFDYAHDFLPNSAIALVVYRQQDSPNDNSFPASYEGSYFYADFYHDWIRYVYSDGTGGWLSTDFATGLNLPVDALLASDGSIYVLEYGNRLLKISHPNGAVPVELSAFTASLDDNVVRLSWRTESELDNFGFAVQRRSLTGAFEQIAFVKGHGTTSKTHVYQYEDSAVLSGDAYYRLKQIDLDGGFEYSAEILVSRNLPARFVLNQNYPNPFNPVTTIAFELPALSGSSSARTVLNVYDIQGHLVKTLVDGQRGHGAYQVEWDGTSNLQQPVSSGVYVYSLQYDSFKQSRKLLFVK